MAKVWFITGTSKGFGRVWAEHALERGDKVVATARNADTLQPLVDQYGDNIKALTLDVTDRARVGAAVKEAIDAFGRLDVVVNNAGYGHFGAIEEVSEQEARDQIETNLFGALWVTQAVLPQLRKQGSGHILQVSSVGGVNAFPMVGLYHASKWGLEGFSQTLSQEVKDLGIKVTIVEPAGFSTDWAGPSAVTSAPIDAYDGFRDAMAKRRTANPAGDPEATGPVILELVDMDEPPLRLLLGKSALQIVKPGLEDRIAEWERFNEMTVRAHGAS